MTVKTMDPIRFVTQRRGQVYGYVLEGSSPPVVRCSATSTSFVLVLLLIVVMRLKACWALIL